MDEALPEIENEPRSRPSGVSIVAVLALLAGFFSFCFTPLSIGQILMSSEPIYVGMRGDPAVYYVSVVGGAIGWVVSIGVIALGFGLWKTKEWARAGMVIYCILAAVWAVVGGAINMIYVTPKAMEIAFATAPTPNKIPPEMMKTIMMFSYITAAVVTLVLCGLYIGIAIYLSKPTVKDAFKPD